MNEEDAFQAALDANPDDHTTRMVFADWLQERGDVRAEGYRALGVNKLYASETGPNWSWWASDCSDNRSGCDLHRILPNDWFYCLPCRPRCERFYPSIQAGGASFSSSRRKTEDDSALAFAALPAARRAELLNPKVPA